MGPLDPMKGTSRLHELDEIASPTRLSGTTIAWVVVMKRDEEAPQSAR
jgi:hypothetical protein